MNLIKAALVFMAIMVVASAKAMTVDQAYRSFYDNSVISSRHCGKNTHHFLKYLLRNRVSFDEAYVISVHSDYADVNHFDARWGSRESYQNGQQYRRANYYFHVFALIDGKAYDFSQADAKTQELEDYLQDSYIPKYRTQNIMMQGRLDREKVLEQYLNREMKVFDGVEFGRDIKAKAIYNGNFIEMFMLNYYSSYISPVNLRNPKINTESGYLPMKADARKICQSKGYMGAIPSGTKFSVTDGKKMAKLYVTLKTPNPLRVDPSRDARVSTNVEETDGSFPYANFQYATQVICTSLSSVL